LVARWRLHLSILDLLSSIFLPTACYDRHCSDGADHGGDGMIVLEESAEAYTVRGAGLEISFRRSVDRWQHFVSLRTHGRSLLLLASDEGTPADEVPGSPALQDLRFEKLSDDIFEFQLLGQAGKGVYSAAVRFDGKVQAIDFDLCARGRSADSSVCTVSRYQIAGDGAASVKPQPDGAPVVLFRGEPAVDLSPVPIEGIPATECLLVGEGLHRRIAAGCFGTTPSGARRKPANVRWRYRIALAGHP
jgi:hypothetical protein